MAAYAGRDYLRARGFLHPYYRRRARAFTDASAARSRLPWRGLSIAFAFLLLIIAMRVYLSRFDRLLDDHTIFGGVTYTDAHVTLTGLLVVCAALVLGAAIAATNAMRVPRGRWLIAAIIPAAVCYFGLQGIAWYVSSFIVKPNELVRETAVHRAQHRPDAASLRTESGRAARVSRRDNRRGG